MRIFIRDNKGTLEVSYLVDVIPRIGEKVDVEHNIYLVTDVIHRMETEDLYTAVHVSVEKVIQNERSSD